MTSHSTSMRQFLVWKPEEQTPLTALSPQAPLDRPVERLTCRRFSKYR